MMMKHWTWSLLYCTALLLSDVVQATYHLRSGDPQLIAAQSYAQARHNARPPFRTLNPTNHRSDYTFRGGYHYRFQPPRIPPPIVYRPIPLSPPVTYQRSLVPVPPFQHRFKGPVAPNMHHTHKGPYPPVLPSHPLHTVKGPFHYKLRAPCPTQSTSVPKPVVLVRPTIFPTTPEPTTASTVAPVTSIVTTVPPLETPNPWTLPVSTQSGFATTVTPVETGVDPCAMGHDCQHTCVSTNASYHCKCWNGYVLNPDKKTCSMKRVDPCAMGHDCQHTCVSTNASYHCKCWNGYVLNPDKKTCSRKSVDPCAMGHDCQHTCVSTNASYHCKCWNGYVLNPDKKTCSIKRVDPCAMGHDCQHTCVSTNASYHCKCWNGYVLNPDKKTCSLKQVKVEVLEDPCKCEARVAFQKQTQAAIQQLTANLADVSGRIQRLEGVLGQA
ncbi:matrilin-3 isoform X4 [Oryzias latipes]|uniref:matrilin-3 isoform X4 n=1 Tax=Oryzias latipes TaxID=8090 RepID=UPI0009D94157|nr:matrilin-3 isoform X4 [Oryzias latipes]